MSLLSKKNQERYDKTLKDYQKIEPDINVILDVTDEEADWLKATRKKEKNIKQEEEKQDE